VRTRAASALTLHDFSAKPIGGGDTSLAAIAGGKPALVVNVASL